VSSIYY